jgi:hypothetical protein
MNKAELQQLVDQVYATYNQQLYEVDKKNVYRAWYDLLNDLEYEETINAFLELAVYETFMPKPGQLRRTVIDARTGEPPHPDPYSAWGIFVGAQKDAHFGTQTNVPKPIALQKTLERLGSSAYDMHTNGDREVFIKTYTAVVEEMQKQKYKILKKDGRGEAI